MNNNSKKHWALSISVLCLSGLAAQWDAAATKVASDSVVVSTGVSDETAPTTYQGRVLSALDQKKMVLFSVCEDNISSDPIDVPYLVSLIRTGDLQRFEVAYVNFHPLQVGLLNEYLKHPDQMHRNYVRMSFDEDIDNPFVAVMDAIDVRRKSDSTAIDQFSFASTELYGKGGGSYLEYSDREYEYALAAYLNALLPADTTVGLGGAEQNDEQIPARIRSQVEGIRSLVSVGLWRLWQEDQEIQVPGDEEDETESLDVDPAFSAVETITFLRDSLWSISGVLENYLLPENRATYQALKPWLKPIPRDSVNDRVLVGETLFEQLQKRADLVGKLKQEKRRTLILGSDPVEQFAVNQYNKKALPSLMEDLLSEGVKPTDMARVFAMNGRYEHVLMRLLPDSASAKSDTTIYPPLSALGGSDTAILSEDPFDMGKKDTVELFSEITKEYQFKDSISMVTLVFAEVGGMEDWLGAMDSAAVAFEEGWSDYGDKKSFMTHRSEWGGTEESKLVFDLAYTYIQPTFKPKYINAMRSVMGLTEFDALNLSTQGISVGINTRNGKQLQNHRLQVAQTMGGNGNYSASYVLYSNMTQFSLGRFFTFGIGGFTGYGEQRYKKFTNTAGGFINQDQPSFVVKNPAYLYGLTIEPAIHVGPFFARLTGGYAWDLGEGTWLYQKEPMNNGSSFKSTGWYVMAEAGLHWKFGNTIMGSGSSDYDYVTDSVSVGRKSPKHQERRNQQ
ncbi:MAG: hypothetical protein FJX91_04265 [Bacteroidetes bacterium]|nr:hypothetical protein [Bacteroidota bacterium]